MDPLVVAALVNAAVAAGQAWDAYAKACNLSKEEADQVFEETKKDLSELDPVKLKKIWED